MIDFNNNGFKDILDILYKIFVSPQSKYSRPSNEISRTIYNITNVDISEANYIYYGKADMLIFRVNNDTMKKINESYGDYYNDKSVMIEKGFMAGKARPILFLDESILEYNMKDFYTNIKAVISQLLSANKELIISFGDKERVHTICMLLAVIFVESIYGSEFDLDKCIDGEDETDKKIVKEALNEDRDELFKYGKIFGIIMKYTKERGDKDNG